MSSRVSRGWSASTASAVIPEPSLRSTVSTGTRVPRITGFPPMMAGLISMRAWAMAPTIARLDYDPEKHVLDPDRGWTPVPEKIVLRRSALFHLLARIDAPQARLLDPAVEALADEAAPAVAA